MQVIKKAVLGLGVSVLFGSTCAFANGTVSGPITLLYTGHFMYLPDPVTLIVKINDPVRNVSGQEFYDTCNGSLAASLIDNPATSNVINQDVSIYQSQLQAANATGSDVTVDYAVDTDYMGTSATVCVIKGVYSGSF